MCRRQIRSLSVSSTFCFTSEAISALIRLEQPSPLALQCSVDSILSVEPGGSVRYIWRIRGPEVERGRLLFHGGATHPGLSARRDLASLASANTVDEKCCSLPWPDGKMQPERESSDAPAMCRVHRMHTPHAPPPACLSPITTQVTTHSPRASKRSSPRARGVQRRQSSCKRPIHGAR